MRVSMQTIFNILYFFRLGAGSLEASLIIKLIILLLEDYTGPDAEMGEGGLKDIPLAQNQSDMYGVKRCSHSAHSLQPYCDPFHYPIFFPV